MKYLKLYESFWGDEASGILPISKDTGRILIALRSMNVLEPHTWGNFGGAIGLNDWGEDEEKLSPEENAIKEMQEEIGYYENVELIPSYVFEKNNFKYYNFLGLVESEFDTNNLDLNWEVDDVKWVTYEELENHPNLHFGIKGLLDNASIQIKTISKKYSIDNE